MEEEEEEDEVDEVRAMPRGRCWCCCCCIPAPPPAIRSRALTAPPPPPPVSDNDDEDDDEEDKWLVAVAAAPECLDSGLWTMEAEAAAAAALFRASRWRLLRAFQRIFTAFSVLPVRRFAMSAHRLPTSPCQTEEEKPRRVEIEGERDE